MPELMLDRHFIQPIYKHIEHFYEIFENMAFINKCFISRVLNSAATVYNN